MSPNMGGAPILRCAFFLFSVSLVLVVEGTTQATINVDTRIVGGTEADIQQHPYQVSIQYANQHFCGGALIARDTVLTAGHCFGEKPPVSLLYYSVVVGSNSTTQGQRIACKSVLVHPKYNETTIDNDISLVTLASNATLSSNVALIQISEKDNYKWESLATVSGWGYQSENGTVSPLLRHASVPLVDRKTCQNFYAGVIEITRNMLCAGYVEGGKDACQGDSGGPLVQDGQLIGIVSFGMGCARAMYPGVYTNVARLVSWVSANSNYTMNHGVTNHLGRISYLLPIFVYAVNN